MPRIEHSITIDRPPAEVFDITNDIDRWHELFDDYHYSEVVSRAECGRFTKLVFRLGNKQGSTWQSWRLLDHEELMAVAQRQDPMFPFRYMHLTWRYEAEGTGTRMTWIQDFELDPAFAEPAEAVAARMDAHGRGNQERIKNLIESGAVTRLAKGRT